jgi:adenosine deaminase
MFHPFGIYMINPSLPLVDLHRHLDGNIRPSTIWQLAQQHNITLPGHSESEFTELAIINDKAKDLLEFLQKLDYGVSVLADMDAVYRVAYENMLDAKAQQLDYVELRFSPYYMAMTHNLNMSELVKVVAQAVSDGAKDTGVKANLIGILSRTFGAETCQKELDSLLNNHQHIAALDLAGDEINFPAAQFETHFKQARDAGFAITVHAGEAAGPDSIWNAINLLGATRIGHGVAATQDAKLMDYMAKQQIAVESCPTSNYQTSTIAEVTDSPIKTFLDHEVIVCLNTDDPAVSNITIQHEYDVAYNTLKLTKAELEKVQLNGVKAAFLSDTDKQVLLQK